MMRIPSQVHLALAELRARQRPDPLAICLSSHHHRLSLQRAPEAERPCTRPALVAAQQPVAEMPRDDAAWLLPGCAPGAAGG
jgi:hypothetical protein